MRAPTWLGETGRRKWSQLLKQLPKLGDHEADALGLLCQSWENYLRAQESITQQGQVINSNGRLFINPACNASNEAWKQIVKLSKLFGLMPGAGDDGAKELGEF